MGLFKKQTYSFGEADGQKRPSDSNGHTSGLQGQDNPAMELDEKTGGRNGAVNGSDENLKDPNVSRDSGLTDVGSSRTNGISEDDVNPDIQVIIPGNDESKDTITALTLEGLKADGEVTLVYARHEKIPMKNFNAEIRAHLDVENFLSRTVLLLDYNETSMQGILEGMLHKLLDESEPTCSIEECKRTLLTHDNVHKLAKTIQGTTSTYSGAYDYEQSWVCVMSSMPTVSKRHVAIARLRHPANLGRTLQEVHFVILVVAPTKEKGTKNALETGRTFATLFADIELRSKLLPCNDEDEFKKLLWSHTKVIADSQREKDEEKDSEKMNGGNAGEEKKEEENSKCRIFGGVRDDLARRLPYYWSDFKDGVVGPKSIQKTISTTIFLYFACLLPSIAFGMLNDNNTKGKIDVTKVFYSQTIGGLIFALIGGQPLTILLTTAPLALYTKVIYNICEDWDLDFFSLYACTGLWNMFFLFVYALSGASVCMKWSTRSTEEIFALFIAIAFFLDAMKDIVHNFEHNYATPACDHIVDAVQNVTTTTTTTVATTVASVTNATGINDGTTSAYETAHECLRENSLLFLLLALGTLWVGVSLFNFNKTPYLNAGKREILADYSLPVSVIFMSFFGTYVFSDVKLQQLTFGSGELFKVPPIGSMPWPAVFGGMGLGFCLSLLFFMDQNISSAMVNAPQNRLKKGDAYHWDLLVVGLMNGFLSFFGMPMVHGALPHSPLHVRALADVEEFVEQGHVYEKITYVRETRLTAIFSHILIGISLFMIPLPLQWIPKPVLDGLFLYLAVTSLTGNQFFERICLLVTEQSAYPPNHYIRLVPQRKIHLFTFTQFVQLAVMCGIGFSPLPYLKMTFPILILLLLPIRHGLVPKFIERKFLNAIDHD